MSEEEVLSNVFEARTLPQRMEGDTTVLSIALFNPDGSPFALPEVPDANPVGEWNTVTVMGAGWANLAEGYEMAYRKRGDGMVEFRGMVEPGTEGTAFFTLPAGFRPTFAHETMFACPCDSGEVLSMTVLPNGDMKTASGSTAKGTSVNALSWVNLAPIRFSTD